MIQKKEIALLLIELPPPTHGTTYINRIIYNTCKNDPKIKFINLTLTTQFKEIGKITVHKIFLNLKLLFRIWWIELKPSTKKVYFSLSMTPLGILRDFTLNFPSLLFNQKRIIHLHGFTFFQTYRSSYLFRFCFKHLTRNSQLIALCNTHKKELLKQIPHLKASHIFILPNTVHPVPTHTPSTYSNSQTTHCLFLSNIQKKKGIFDVLEAIKKIPNIQLNIAGKFFDTSLEELNHRIKTLNCEGKVHYKGFVDTLKKHTLLSTNHIFILPSKLEEGSPVSILEAMAYGLPIISTQKGCIEEMITTCGIILPNNFKASHIEKAIKKIMTHYKKYSNESLTTFNQKYKPDTFKATFIQLLKL